MPSSITTAPAKGSSTAAPERARPRPLRVALAALLLIAAECALIGLGTWQVHRLAWKEALIAAAHERPGLPALDFATLPPDARADPVAAGVEYRRLVLDGEYRDGEARVFTSLPEEDARGPASGPGVWIMTPFVVAGSGEIVWVNRGFVPQDPAAGAAPGWAPPPSGAVQIAGLIRRDDPPNWLRPADDVARDLFYSRSVDGLSAARGLPVSVRFTLDLAAQPGPATLPQAGETRFTFANNHLQYAVTWYGLAAALLAVFGAFSRRTLTRGRRGDGVGGG